MVPDVTFENFVSGTAADKAAHLGRPRPYSNDLRGSGSWNTFTRTQGWAWGSYAVAG